MKVSNILISLALCATTMAYQHPAFLSRREMMQASAFVAVNSLLVPATSAAETPEEKAARKKKEAEEKEARRQAEETKKRLAVGRIGTI